MKKKIYALLFCFSLLASMSNAQNSFPASGSTGIGTISPDASSILEMQSTKQGMLVPRMTKNQRDAIVSPATGLMIYQTNSTPGFYYYSGTVWTAISSKGANTALSNLVSPTAVNADIIPGLDNVINLGSSSLRYRSANIGSIVFQDNTSQSTAFVPYGAGTGISIASNTITNTAPDQPVTLTGGGATSISGVYPNFTISSTDNNSNYTAGTGIDITGNTVTNTAPSPWIKSGTNVYYTGGNVGIGTVIPQKKLHVYGGDLFVESSSGAIGLGYSGGNQWEFVTTGGGADLLMGSTKDGINFNFRHYFSQNGDLGIGGFSGVITPKARLDIIGKGTTAATNNLMLRNSNRDTLLCMRDDGLMGIGIGINKNSNNIGRTVNISGNGINLYNTAGTVLGGAIFPTDTSLVLWSNSNANNYLVLQPSWGNVGISMYGPKHKLQIGLDDAAKPSTSTWTIASDARLKTIDGNYLKGLKEIIQLKPIAYHYKNTAGRKFDEATLKTQSVGFTAQDVQQLFPEAVSTDDDGYLSLNIHPILIAEVNAIIELNKKVESKDAVIATQQQQIDKLQSQMNAILQKIDALQTAQQACCNAAANAQSSTVGNQQAVSLNNGWGLDQNTPNPFHGITKINCIVPVNNGNVFINFYSQSGALLKSVKVTGEGKNTIILHANELASGTYKYALLADGKLMDSKQMILVK